MPNFDDLFAPQPVQREDALFDKDAWAAKKQQEREGVYLMIDTYAREMSIDGGLFQAYLDVQARFDRYSVSNAILVAAQCPEATRLADFDAGGIQQDGCTIHPGRGGHNPGNGRNYTADMNRLFAAQEKAQKDHDAG